MSTRFTPTKANIDGQFGESDAPEYCPDCGDAWFGGERLHTGDELGIGGWEDWMHCKKCNVELFFPVVRPPLARAIESARGIGEKP